jgi:hypothetical protein
MALSQILITDLELLSMVSSVSVLYGEKGHKKYLKVERQRPVLNVIKVVFGPFLY